MASRNERKRRAKERHAALVAAVAQAERLEHERLVAKVTPIVNLERNPFYERLPKSSNGVLVERAGTVLKGKFTKREPVLFEPLRYDGNESGFGQLRKRWTK